MKSLEWAAYFDALMENILDCTNQANLKIPQGLRMKEFMRELVADFLNDLIKKYSDQHHTFTLDALVNIVFSKCKKSFAVWEEYHVAMIQLTAERNKTENTEKALRKSTEDLKRMRELAGVNKSDFMNKENDAKLRSSSIISVRGPFKHLLISLDSILLDETSVEIFEAEGIICSNKHQEQLVRHKGAENRLYGFDGLKEITTIGRFAK